MIQPIWKDAWIDLGSADSVEFALVVSGATIYTGKAYRKPDADSIKIRINDIVADYLSRQVPVTGDGIFTEDNYTLEVSVQVGGSEVESVIFSNDWSFDYSHDVETDGIADPINGRAVTYMPLVMSVYDKERVRMDITYKDGTSSFEIVTIAQSRDFNDDFNDDFAIINGRESGTGAVAFDLSKYSDIASVEIDGHVFTPVECGPRYALFYVNAFGGWDTFLVEGLCRRTDRLERHERSVVYDNSDPINRGRDNYLNEIVRCIEMHTGWLSDSQSLRMHHLLNSPAVYMYDSQDGIMLPLVLTDTDTEYKTFKGNERKLVNYTINAEIAHEIIRR